MKVGELIRTLGDLDPDLDVYVRGYEDGVDDVEVLEPVMVTRDVNLEWYYGDHSTSEHDAADGKACTPGIQLCPSDE